MRPGSFEPSRAQKWRGRLALLGAALPAVAALLVSTCDAVQLARPAGLWAWAALAPLVVLHLLIPERIPMRVATLALWQAARGAPSAPPRLRLHPFYRETAFWLRASMLGLVACALASPKLYRLGSDPALLLLIDRSATMAARPSDQRTSRDQRAIQIARHLAATARVPVGLVAQSTEERVQIAPGSAGAVQAALDRLERPDQHAPPSGWAGLSTLLDTASWLRQAYGGDLRIVLLSDNIDGRAEQALLHGPLRASCTAGWCTLQVVTDEIPLTDVALVAAPTQVTVGIPFKLQVVNSGSARVKRNLHFEQQSQVATVMTVDLDPGHHEIDVKPPLGRTGCWTVRLEKSAASRDDLAAGKELCILAAKAAGKTCLVASLNDAGKEFQRWFKSGGGQFLEDDLLPYEARSVAALETCAQVVLFDPAGHQDFLHLPSVQALDWIAVYPVQTSVPARAAVSRIAAELPPLSELEPRLLPLVRLRGLELPPDTTTLIAVTDDSGEQPAVVKWTVGHQQRIALALRWGDTYPDERGVARDLLAMLALWRRHDTIDAIVTDRMPEAVPRRPLCPATPKSARRSEPGIYDLAAPAALPQLVRVSALAPDLGSIQPVDSGPAAARPLQGPREYPLWPWLLALAFFCSLLEQAQRKESLR